MSYNINGPATVSIDLTELNGDLFYGANEGERMVDLEDNHVIFPHNMKMAANPHEEQYFSKEEVTGFLTANIVHLLSIKANGAKKYTADQALVIAYRRLLAARLGLISPAFNPGNFNVDYNDAKLLDQAQTQAIFAKIKQTEIDTLLGKLTKQMRQDMSETFTDIVCAIAHVFRVRGHHFMPAYQSIYENIWSRCRYDPNMLYLPWEYIATTSLHAIFPCILDSFYQNAVNNSLVSGALAKRFNSAAAGVAGVHVLMQGLRDLKLVAPGVYEKLPDECAYLEQLEKDLSADRWKGSVNCRYYGSPQYRVNENKLGAIAATIKAALEGLSENAPLGKSPALARIAATAPITGAVLARAIKKLGDRDEVVLPLLALPAPKTK